MTLIFNSYFPELDSGNNTDNDELEEEVSWSVNSSLDSSECTRKRPRIVEGKVETTVILLQIPLTPVKLNRKTVLSWRLALHKPESSL